MIYMMFPSHSDQASVSAIYLEYEDHKQQRPQWNYGRDQEGDNL